MSTASTPSQSYEFRAEVQQLLHILVHSLYTEREIFLRELLSNASDALHRLQFEMLTNPNVLDPDAELAIHIHVDEEGKTITVSDTGIGMNHDEMVENLGTIAHSGAMGFMQALRDSGKSSSDIIGQFGVGFYSVFMVADRVQVISRSFRPDDTAWVWTSDGSNNYTIEPADKTTRGTDIVIHVKEDAKEFLNEHRLKNVIRTHSNYIAFPIYVGEEVANAQSALWRKPAREVTEQEYKDFYKQVTFDFNEPLLHIHQISDAPTQYYSLLYVPSTLDRGLMAPEHQSGPKLYARKVLIQDHAKDLLPEWLRFVVGVVDSEDLPLNISRETVHSNRVMATLKGRLTSKLISAFTDLAEDNAEQYNKFWEAFGRLIKEGVCTDFANKDKLLPLLRFHTSKRPTEWVSLAQYVEGMAEGQTDIYYLFGEDIKSLSRSPHLDIFQSRGIEVLYLTDPIDSFVVNAIAEFDGKKLHNGADSDLDLPAEEETAKDEGDNPPSEEVTHLLDTFTSVLEDRVAEVRESKVLTGSPARLVSGDKGFGADMERLSRMMGQDFEAPKRILEINPRHPLIRDMAASHDEALSKLLVEQLFESALLMEGIHPNPADMLPRIQAIMEAAAKRKD